MVSGDTAVDNSVAGYIAGEQIVLTVTPTGATYSWGISKPSGSTVSSDISNETDQAPRFTPGIAGYYVITLTVDSTTTYVLRINVTQVAQTTSYEAIRYAPKTDSAVPTPALGMATFYSDDQETLAAKLPSAVVVPLFIGTVGAALTDADQTLQIGEGVHRSQETALTVNRSKTLGTTGASLGHIIWIHRLEAAAFTLAVINGGVGAGTLLTMPVSERHSAAFRFDGTDWVLEQRVKLV